MSVETILVAGLITAAFLVVVGVLAAYVYFIAVRTLAWPEWLSLSLAMAPFIILLYVAVLFGLAA